MALNGISDVSSQLNIPKDTLRYYDKLGLTHPQRGQNRYRSYTDQDLLDLMYIQVLKYADFSLEEIRKILNNKKICGQLEANKMDTVRLLCNKKERAQRKIEHLKRIISLIDLTVEIVNDKPDNDPTEVNELIRQVFNEINTDCIKGANGHV